MKYIMTMIRTYLAKELPKPIGKGASSIISTNSPQLGRWNIEYCHKTTKSIYPTKIIAVLVVNMHLQSMMPKKRDELMIEITESLLVQRPSWYTISPIKCHLIFWILIQNS